MNNSTSPRLLRSAVLLLFLSATAVLSITGPTTLGSAGIASAEASPLAAPTTVFLVRHAEKAAAGDAEFDASNPSDPPLTAPGHARAEALARMLEEAGVTAIYASQFARTQQTVAPLAELVGIELQVHSAADVRGLAGLVGTEHAGGVVVIAGHSNTVPALVEALGAGPVPPIEEAWEYDNLYVVTLDGAGEAAVSTLKFGAASMAH